MSWDDCRTLVAGGMTIGSHTRHHARLAELSPAAAKAEMSDSKDDIERALGITCRHFCAPYGLPGRDFNIDRDGRLAREMGFSSLATGLRGPNRPGGDPFSLRRDHVLANWGLYQLRYFLASD
jgi:peptidoglycan/xylan/chitin deacetylase (PgdA/CDA1 family)